MEQLLCCAKWPFRLQIFKTEGNGRLYEETERNRRNRTGPKLAVERALVPLGGPTREKPYAMTMKNGGQNFGPGQGLL